MRTGLEGLEVMRAFLPASPFVEHVGLVLVDADDGRATLRLPFDERVVTVGQVVHGGAIATLVDTAAMVAAWSGAEIPDNLRGSTVSLAVSYLAAAEGSDVTAEACVSRRGRRLTHVHVDVRGDHGPVATGQAVYQIG